MGKGMREEDCGKRDVGNGMREEEWEKGCGKGMRKGDWEKGCGKGDEGMRLWEKGCEEGDEGADAQSTKWDIYIYHICLCLG